MNFSTSDIIAITAIILGPLGGWIANETSHKIREKEEYTKNLIKLQRILCRNKDLYEKLVKDMKDKPGVPNSFLEAPNYVQQVFDNSNYKKYRDEWRARVKTLIDNNKEAVGISNQLLGYLELHSNKKNLRDEIQTFSTHSDEFGDIWESIISGKTIEPGIYHHLKFLGLDPTCQDQSFEQRGQQYPKNLDVLLENEILSLKRRRLSLKLIPGFTDKHT